MNRVSAWVHNQYPWLILVILVILLINLLLGVGGRGRGTNENGYSGGKISDKDFEQLEPCTSRPGTEKVKSCETFTKEYQLIRVENIERYEGGAQQNVLVIDSQKRVGSVDCVRYIRRNGEEREKRKHFPNRDTCPPKWDEEP